MIREIEISVEERFDMWYLQPLKMLESRQDEDHGACAIIALMVVMPLYERLYHFAVKNGVPDNRPVWVMNDLHLQSIDEAKLFWNVFRDGLCHTGSFFCESDKSIKHGWTLPKISLDAKHPSFPTFEKTEDGKDVIIVNPWGFMHHVLQKYSGNTSLLEYASAPLLPLHYLVEDTETSQPT